MTVKEALKKEAVSRGLFDTEVDEFFVYAKNNNLCPEITAVLNKDWEGYPLVFHNVSWGIVKIMIGEWLGEVKPLHWARAMFDDKILKELVEGTDTLAAQVDKELTDQIISETTPTD